MAWTSQRNGAQTHNKPVWSELDSTGFRVVEAAVVEVAVGVVVGVVELVEVGSALDVAAA